WHNAGHDVTLYNNPRENNVGLFKQMHINQFDPKKDRDFLIVFRSPNDRMFGAKGKKIWWSTDQSTVGNFKTFGSKVDKIVVISEFHAKHFKDAYGLDDTIIIDLPVRLNDYKNNSVEKVPYRFIFSSIPDRGLFQMAQIWDMMRGRLPEDASLVITSDYRLWGVGAPNNETYKMMFIKKPGAEFIGAVKRKRLIAEQLKADIHAYSCLYDELFCISIAESQVAGAYPITSDIGALQTTNMGTFVEGNPVQNDWMTRFTNKILEVIDDREGLEEKRREVQERAVERFDPKRIMKEWNEKVFI
ncbi:MAG: glycosyltransferase, partial [Candidatus Heimdallarchaeota archaeon]|nr:glycosyltransferase [Candidatus Heimdallarchaeota archaeon]